MMKDIFITRLKIEHVRHLKNVEIELSSDEPKHLILTGKNGSGKTSVLEALSRYLNGAIAADGLIIKTQTIDGTIHKEIVTNFYQQKLDNIKCGIEAYFNELPCDLCFLFDEGQFILAYYKDHRAFKADVPNHVEKIGLKEKYSIEERPSQEFIKYLLDSKVTEALLRNKGDVERADEIAKWFDNLQDLLRKVFSDDTLELIFDVDTYKFSIKEKNRELFDFNTLSSGFAAVLDIVVDIIMRMEKKVNKSFSFDMPGIVLIDEIETHLHLELQKTILEFLTTLFPRIQFIVSTHSPFVLNSMDNVVIYDLENKITVKEGLSNVPYNGIVEGYFNVNSMSNTLREKFGRYKELVKKKKLSREDFAEIADLEVFLDEIPDYLAFTITTEYHRLKLEFESREDI